MGGSQGLLCDAASEARQGTASATFGGSAPVDFLRRTADDPRTTAVAAANRGGVWAANLFGRQIESFLSPVKEVANEERETPHGKKLSLSITILPCDSSYLCSEFASQCRRGSDAISDAPARLSWAAQVCKIARPGVTPGTIFTINVNGTPYSVPAARSPGLCVLAGQFPLDTQVTVQEVIPAGHVVSAIQVYPDNRRVSKDVTLGKVIVKIGTGVTEVVYVDKVSAVLSSSARRAAAAQDVTGRLESVKRPTVTASPATSPSLSQEKRGLFRLEHAPRSSSSRGP